MSSSINPVSTKVTIALNTSSGAEVSTGNVTIGSLALDISAAKISALVAAATPLLAYPVVSTKKTDTGLLVEA